MTEGINFREISEGAFLAYDNLGTTIEFQTSLVSSDEPWGVYTMVADDLDYTSVFSAASEYKAVQVVGSSDSNTAQGVPVTANSYRQAEQFVFHTQIEYASVDARSQTQAIIRSLKEIIHKTSFKVILPTGRIVTAKFLSADEIWPFKFGYVDVIIQAVEYNPFPISSTDKEVNKRYNSVFGNEANIRGAPVTTTTTPKISDEVLA